MPAYSPILSIATAAIEISAAIWAFFVRGRKSIRFTASALLFFLAAYQVIEAVMCSNPAGFTLLGRIAFLVVLWLPPTGLLLLAYMDPSRLNRWFAWIGYALAFGIFIWMVVDQHPIGVSVCLVVFARYYDVVPRLLSVIYGGYYQAGLLSILFLSAISTAKTREAFQRKQNAQLLFGSLAFIVPAMIVVNVFDLAKGALSSILCHFALLLALFIIRLLWLEHKKS